MSGEYEQAVEKHGGISAAARALGIPKSTFRDRLIHERGGKPPTRRSKSSKMSGGLSSEELLLRHSIEHQIRHAAEKLESGVFVPESEFIREIGVSGGYKHIVERPEFSQYRGKASGGAVYWSHPDSIAQMKEQHVLRD